jgi:hypothetical protein
MSGDDEMNSTLECIMSDKRGILPLRPFVPGAYDHRFSRPRAGDAYPLFGSSGPCLGSSKGQVG